MKFDSNDINILPLICYEIIFPNLVDKQYNYNLIINISEDAWFGSSIGPHQHFAKAIFRSIESESYTIRSANKGISAFISPKGKILKILQPDEIGNIELDIPINKKRLNSLKSTCGIVNIGRASVMDYEHLRSKLERNEISGAILDVFSEEPINRNSKFWDTPNLVITPHISSDSKGNYIEMVLEKFFKNLKLFIDKKELPNQVDPNLGY